jgi:hypothetical protein
MDGGVPCQAENYFSCVDWKAFPGEHYEAKTMVNGQCAAFCVSASGEST